MNQAVYNEPNPEKEEGEEDKEEGEESEEEESAGW
ncbi:hypothetical protein E2C01_098773 [Portunus trituberculatus]|uniref:Uncharacterized protein n=2 Tax=Portunus trituberculatus TaxID=210409 RepID=A0A5B7KDQ1_PORTR|nr:hypothetical protein [Portunus trituberculatus]